MQFMIMMPEEKEARRLNNAKQRIENARNFAKLRVEARRADAEIDFIENSGLATLIEDNTQDLARLVEQKKITDAQMLKDEPEDKDAV